MDDDGALRWYIEQGLWSFRVATPSESGDTAWDYELVLEISRSMALASILRMRATRTRQEVRE
jgi:hypothetical protein